MFKCKLYTQQNEESETDWCGKKASNVFKWMPKSSESALNYTFLGNRILVNRVWSACIHNMGNSIKYCLAKSKKMNANLNKQIDLLLLHKCIGLVFKIYTENAHFDKL